MNALSIVGSVLILIAAVIHVLIFAMESVLWSRPAIWKSFGLRSQQHADIARPLAFNQGFYNLFLAIGASVGIALLGASSLGTASLGAASLGASSLSAAGVALSLFAAGSMVVAATVLILSSPKLARAAAIQGVAPLAGITLLLLSPVAG